MKEGEPQPSPEKSERERILVSWREDYATSTPEDMRSILEKWQKQLEITSPRSRYYKNLQQDIDIISELILEKTTGKMDGFINPQA